MAVSAHDLLSALATLDFPVAALDDQSRVVWGNDVWRATGAGSDPGAYLGHSYLEVCEKAQGPLAFGAEATAKALRALLSGRIASAVVEYPCPTPAEPQGWWQAHLTRGVGPVAVVVSHLDITREHLTQVRLTEASVQLKLLADNTIDAVMLWDGAACCVWASPSVKEVFGRAPDTLVGQRLQQLIPGDALQRMPRLEQLARLPVGKPTTVTLRLQVDGVQRAFEVRIKKVSAAPLQFVVAARNIDQRLDYEGRLHWQQVALDGAEEVASLGLCVWRPGVRWEWSRNLLQMHGIRSDRPPTLTEYLREVDPQDRAHVRRGLQGQGDELTFRYRRPDGSLRTLELHVRGGPHGERIGLFRDVTGERRLQQTVTQLATERADLLQEYFSSRDRERMLLARELHDGLGSALTGLVLAAQRLARPGVANPRREAAALGRQAQAVLETVRSVSHTRHLAHLDALPFAEALEAMARGYREVSTARITVETSRGVPTHAPSGLLRIAQECLTNAVRHARARNIRVSCQVSGRYLTLRVEDDGIGMKLKPSPGVGMGLSGITLRAEALGGEARFRSRTKRGTSVEVRVPMLFRGWSET